jgi:hypothetical protein
MEPTVSPVSWPGLSPPPRCCLLRARTLGVAGTSPATTAGCVIRTIEIRLRRTDLTKKTLHQVQGEGDPVRCRPTWRRFASAPPGFKWRKPDDTRTEAFPVLSARLPAKSCLARCALPMMRLLLGARRGYNARSLWACPPIAKGKVATPGGRSREALISNLVRPIVLYRIGRS